MADLRPYPFPSLLRRMFRELDSSDSIFDLPTRKFYAGDATRDLSILYHGHRAGTPLGPAAGPQTQMAQNLVLCWLGGSRILELKTVQVRDDLAIPRPCIDMRTVGYNAEWSQELKVQEALDEYVKGMMLIEILKASGRVPEVESFSPLVYDLSLGYDLAGVKSEKVQAFVRGMLDASTVVDRFRREIPAEFRRYRDLDFPARLSDTMTLSTFHGCPPHEVEGIIEYLMRGPGLHCTIKLNPMMLGPSEARRLLHDVLGYRDIAIPESAFERDMKWDDMTAILERLDRVSREVDRGLGVKFSNTLIVENRVGFLPESEKEVYLSGAPLHVLAVNLVGQFRRHFGDRFPISFSAGIDRSNFADAAAMGLVPITVCSDLLKPGGYGRMQSYHNELIVRMKAVGASTLDEYVLKAYGLPVSDLPEARLRNTDEYVRRATGNPRYTAERNSRAPRRIGRHLKLFDCISCDKCVPVCPNDANFTFVPDLADIPSVTLVQDGAGWSWRARETVHLEENHQIGNFADFCNDCGNCDVFCPEEGGPYKIKPRFFGSEAGWRERPDLDGFFVERTGASVRMLGRIQGHEYGMEWEAGRVVYSGSDFSVRYEESDPAATVTGSGPLEVDLTFAFIMDRIRRGVLDSGGVNYINCLTEGVFS